MKKVCFFLSACDIDPKYAKPALDLVGRIVKKGYTFVYGGSDIGLMKQAADEVHKLHGKIIGVSSIEFQHILRTKMDETYVGKNIPERKSILMEKSDAIIALPGGAGTLDEITDIIEHRKLGVHTKPIVFLNTDGFWDGLLKQYQRMYDEGFMNVAPDELYLATEDLSQILTYIDKKLHHSEA